MPELPEVESVRLGLIECLAQPIVHIELSPPPLLKSLVPESSENLQELLGQSFVSVARRGKYLLWETADMTLLGHLGMSGVLLWNQEPRPHTHWAMTMRSGVLRYSDPRRFGFWCLRRQGHDHPEWLSLGPDALDASAADWQTRGGSSKRTLKDILLDQRIVSGVGNIYASEILFAARFSPWRRGCELSALDWEAIATHTRRILSASVAQRGTTFSDYRLTNGKGGAFQGFLQVFQKTGQACPSCGTPIQQAVQAARSTFWCPECQIS